MASVAVKVTRFFDDHFPGFVECHLTDAAGQLHVFIEKGPVVSAENLWSDTVYPCDGSFACEVIEEFVHEHFGPVVRVTTDRPLGIESTAEISEFVVLPSQLSSE